MIIHATFGLQKSNNVIHMFGTWLQGIKWKERNLILTGVSVVCWAMWLSRNDIVFDNVNPQPCLQILFRTTYWIRFWDLLRKEDDMNTIPENCQVLESMAMEIFTKKGSGLVIGFVYNKLFTKFCDNVIIIIYIFVIIIELVGCQRLGEARQVIIE